MRQGELDKQENDEGDAEEHAVIPGKTNSAIEGTRSDIDRDRADNADGVKAGQRGKVCHEQQHHRGKPNGNEQRINWNTVAV